MNILIVSLYFQPLNNIASTRISHFARTLEEKGHAVSVLTRHYAAEELSKSNLSIGLTESGELEGGYLRQGNYIYTSFSGINKKTKTGRFLPPGVRGYYYQKQGDPFHYSFVENGLKAFEKEWSQQKFDIILASSPPLSVAILASEISLRYHIPWVADFRDSPVLDEDQGMIRRLKIKGINKLLRSASGIIFVSPGMKTLNNKFFNAQNSGLKQTIVYNGFEPAASEADQEVLKHFNEITAGYDLTLLYTGSIYRERNLTFFLSSLKKLERRDVIVVLAGVQDNFKEEILRDFPDLPIRFIDKVNQATSIALQQIANGLLLTIWKGSYTGFSGKVFEYLSSGSWIILDHQPANDLHEFLQPFPNQICAQSNTGTFNEILERIKNNPVNTPSEELLNSIKRNHQTELLEKFLYEIAGK